MYIRADASHHNSDLRPYFFEGGKKVVSTQPIYSTSEYIYYKYI